MNASKKLRAPAEHRSPLDRAFFALVTSGWDSHRLTHYRAHLQRHNAALSSDFHNDFSLLDVKATGLLTHVSLMIAGLGLIAPLVTESEIEKGIVILEIAAYLLIAVGCLRCLSVFTPRQFREAEAGVPKLAERELILRRELYSLCNRLAIALTIFVFLILPALYFYTPGH
jgi:hypothetical protein